MVLRNLLTIWVCKVVYWILRRRGSHGAALPGLIAERINPKLINKLTTLPEGIIVITGTNGKTTTTHLVAEVLRRSGKRVFTNHSGSNMTRGLLASIVRFSKLSGRLPYDVAVLEIDEAYAAKLAPALKPRAAILTNVLRDQLDRFGEIDHTARLLYELAKHCTELVAYNICDPRLQSIPRGTSARTVSFGYAGKLSKLFPVDDNWHGKPVHRDTPSANYVLAAMNDLQVGVVSPAGRVVISRERLPGSHNALNLVAAMALLTSLFPGESFDFNKLQPPYGRGELVMFGKKAFTLQLVKNPGGFMVAMNVHPEQPALIVINDAIADGRDVSWLWDIDVSPLATRPAIYAAGIRAYDIANRLHYEGIKAKSVITEVDHAVRNFTKSNNQGTIFLTYTAMLEARKVLHRLAKDRRFA